MEQITTDFLKNTLETQYAKTQVNSILEGLTKSRKTTIRVNTIKTSMTEIKEILEKEEISFKEVPWNDFALIIENADESRIRKLQIYNNGEIYMQRRRVHELHAGKLHRAGLWLPVRLFGPSAYGDHSRASRARI